MKEPPFEGTEACWGLRCGFERENPVVDAAGGVEVHGVPVVSGGKEGANLADVVFGEFVVVGDGDAGFVFGGVGGDAGELPEDFGEEVGGGDGA